MAKKLFLKTYKGLTMHKQPTKWDIVGACIFGAILGAFIAFNF
jgi:RsiW-degrading membrane proteinase PrsW (M82 family)